MRGKSQRLIFAPLGSPPARTVAVDWSQEIGGTMNIVKVARAVKGISQRELAEAAAVKPWRLCRIERGLVMPRPDEILRLWGVLTSESGEQAHAGVRDGGAGR